MKHFSSFRNNRSNKKKGHDSVLTLVELQNKLVVGDELGMIGIWRHQQDKFERERKLVGHSHAVRCCLVIDKEAGIIASCSEGELNSIRVWNINDGMCLATLKAHKQTVSALVCLRSVLLVSASHDGKICLWDLNKNLLVNEFDGHGYPVLCLDKSKDQNILISGGDDYRIKVWQTDNFSIIATIEIDTGSVTCICTLDDNRFAAGSSGGQITIWSFQNINAEDKPKFSIQAHSENVCGMVYLPRKNCLVSVSEDRAIKLWNATTGSMQHQIFKAHPDSIACVGYWQNESMLATGCWDGLIKLWHLE